MEVANSARVDLTLFRCCVLVDVGEWDRACTLVQTVSSEQRRAEGISHSSLKAVKLGLQEWFARETEHWNASLANEAASGADVERAANCIVDHLIDLCRKSHVPWPHAHSTVRVITDELATHASKQRGAGHLHDSETTTALMFALGHRLVRDFPQHPSSHMLLSEAFRQQSKNGWPREDYPAIRLALSKSVEILEHAVLLDPDDFDIQRMLRDCKERLTRVPQGRRETAVTTEATVRGRSDLESSSESARTPKVGGPGKTD